MNSDKVLEWYEGLFEEEAAKFINSLIHKSNRQRRIQLCNESYGLLRIDFITELPAPLAKHVLSFCDAQTLASAAQVNRRWRELANDDNVWRHLCAQHINRKCVKCGWGLPLVLEAAKTQNERVKRRKRHWKDVYVERLRVERNWRRGCFTLTRLKHNEGIRCLQFHDDRIVSGGVNGTLRVWDSRTGHCINIIKGASHDTIMCLQFDKVKIISGSMNGIVAIWDFSGTCVRQLEAHDGPVHSLQFDDEKLVSGGDDSAVRVWFFKDRGENPVTLCGHSAAINSVRIHNNKILSGSEDSTIRLWNIEDDRSFHCAAVFEGHDGGVTCMQVSHNRVVSCAADHTIKIWDLETTACLRTLFGHTDTVTTLQFDNLRIVSGSDDETIRIWDRDTGGCLHKFQAHAGGVTCLQFSDSRLVSGGDDGMMRIYDFAAVCNGGKLTSARQRTLSEASG
eukprot:Clim_evm61s77 gene=Clim_evmTU61s77